MHCPIDIRDNPIFKYMWQVPKDGGNLIVIVNGLPRTGKSELAVDLAYNLFRGEKGEYLFDVAKHMAWDKINFQKKIRTYTKIGSCIIWDEAGIAELGAHARQFWSESNIAISSLFQTMGFHRQIIFITLPMKVMLDKHLRMLGHIMVETKKIYKQGKRCYANFYLLESSSKYKEVLAKYPRYKGVDGFIYKVRKIAVPRAPEEIRAKYIQYSELFKKWLELRIEGQERGRAIIKTEGRRIIPIDLKQVFEKIKAKPDVYLDRRGNLNVSALFMVPPKGVNISTRQAEVLAMWWQKDKKKAV